jgi:hypothetical protein
VGRLAGHPQGLAAGGEDAQVGAGPQQGVRQPGAGVHQVLAVVQQQQQTLLPQVVVQRRRHRPPGGLPHAQGLRDGGGHQGLGGQGGARVEQAGDQGGGGRAVPPAGARVAPGGVGPG